VLAGIDAATPQIDTRASAAKGLQFHGVRAEPVLFVCVSNLHTLAYPLESIARIAASFPPASANSSGVASNGKLVSRTTRAATKLARAVTSASTMTAFPPKSARSKGYAGNYEYKAALKTTFAFTAAPCMEGRAEVQLGHWGDRHCLKIRTGFYNHANCFNITANDGIMKSCHRPRASPGLCQRNETSIGRPLERYPSRDSNQVERLQLEAAQASHAALWGGCMGACAVMTPRCQAKALATLRTR